MAHQSIQDDLVEPGHIVGMKFSDGWWFIQATGTEYNEIKPYTLQNNSGNRSALSSNQSGVKDQSTDDSNNNLILEPNDSDRNTVHQIFYGVAPTRMQVFTLFGRNRNKAIENYDEPGDVGSFVSGEDSPYDNPSSETEVFHVNSMDPLRLQPFNPTDTSFEATVSFHVNSIRYVTITDKNVMKAALQGQQPSKKVNMGLGSQNSEQVAVPDWAENAFGEHIMTTSQILKADDSRNNQDSREFNRPTDLQ